MPKEHQNLLRLVFLCLLGPFIVLSAWLGMQPAVAQSIHGSESLNSRVLGTAPRYSGTYKSVAVGRLGDQAWVIAWRGEDKVVHLAQIDPVTLEVVARVELPFPRGVDQLVMRQVGDEVLLAMGAGLGVVRLSPDPERRTGLNLLEHEGGELDNRMHVGVGPDGACVIAMVDSSLSRFQLDEDWRFEAGEYDVAKRTARLATFDWDDCDAPFPEDVFTTPYEPVPWTEFEQPVKCAALDQSELCVDFRDDPNTSGGPSVVYWRHGGPPEGVLSPVPAMLDPLEVDPGETPFTTVASLVLVRELRAELEDWCELLQITQCGQWSEIVRHRVVERPLHGESVELRLRGARIEVAWDAEGVPHFDLIEHLPWLCDGSDCFDWRTLPKDYKKQKVLKIDRPRLALTITVEQIADVLGGSGTPKRGAGWEVTDIEYRALNRDDPLLEELTQLLEAEYDCKEYWEQRDDHSFRHVCTGVGVSRSVDASDIEKGRVTVYFGDHCLELAVRFVHKKRRWKLVKVGDVSGPCFH